MAESTTTRVQLHRWSADTDTPSRDEVDGSFANIELFVVGYQHGTLAARPAPGKFGWFYQADDQGAHGHIYWDTGTTWIDLTMEYGLGTDISASAPGDTALGGSTGMPADAGHRHAREAWGASVANIKFGLAKSDGVSGAEARADHTHGTPALQNNGAGVTSRSALSFVGLLVSDDAAGDRTVVTLPLSALMPSTLSVGGAGQVGTSGTPSREDHTHPVSRQLTSYNELYHDVTANTATTTLDASTSCNKRVTVQTNTTIAVANVPTGCMYSINIWLIEDGTGNHTIAYPAGTRWPGNIQPNLATGPNARNVVTLTTFDGGSTWDGFVAGRDMRSS